MLHLTHAEMWMNSANVFGIGLPLVFSIVGFFVAIMKKSLSWTVFSFVMLVLMLAYPVFVGVIKPTELYSIVTLLVAGITMLLLFVHSSAQRNGLTGIVAVLLSVGMLFYARHTGILQMADGGAVAIEASASSH